MLVITLSDGRTFLVPVTLIALGFAALMCVLAFADTASRVARHAGYGRGWFSPQGFAGQAFLALMLLLLGGCIGYGVRDFLERLGG